VSELKSADELMTIRRGDIGVISAFRLVSVLLVVLVPLGSIFAWYVHAELERAILLNNVSMAERYVTKADVEAAQARLSRRLDDIQGQLEQNRKLTEKVAIRLKVEP
jgi:hypothetical protein